MGIIVMGRHTTYDPEVADRLLETISDGTSLTKACQEHGIARRTVRQWLTDNPSFKAAHAASVQMRFEALADDVVDIADSAVGGDAAAVQAKRLQVDSRRWLLSKVLPAAYGDRIEVSGAGGEALMPSYGPAQIPQLMTIFQILEPRATNAQLHHAATTFIERAGALLPAPGGDK